MGEPRIDAPRAVDQLAWWVRHGEELRLEVERLREAGDALYDATSDSWNAGYLEEATDARDRWDELRHPAVPTPGSPEWEAECEEFGCHGHLLDAGDTEG